ncbi:MAG: hypothetical protein ACE5I4_00245 [Thermoplasmata archaeon]
MKKGIWTLATVVVLILLALTQAASLAGLGPGLEPASHIFALLFLGTLGVVAWMETRWGALLVVVMGLLLFVAEIIAAALLLNPQFGPQLGQLAFAAVSLVIPLFGYLSYWSISKER